MLFAEANENVDTIFFTSEKSHNKNTSRMFLIRAETLHMPTTNTTTLDICAEFSVLLHIT